MKNLYKIFLIIGIVLIIASLCWAGYIVWDNYRAGAASENVVVQMRENIPEEKPDENTPLYELNPQLPMPTEEFEDIEYIGVLDIPSLSLTFPIVSEWSYPKMRIAPCRYSGSAYMDNMVIAGHNYTAHFGRLDNLRYGDEITFTDLDGNVFHYVVSEVEVLRPNEVKAMKNSDYPLTLFTCTLSGAMRITIRCDKA